LIFRAGVGVRKLLCRALSSIADEENGASQLSNHKPTMIAIARQPHYANNSPRAKEIALPLIAVAALMGCAVDTTPHGDVEFVDADSPASAEPFGTEAQPLFAGVLDTDSVKVTGDKVDFGGSVWGINSPVASGTMTWSIVDGFYTPRLTGTLHMKDADGKFARMHISYWDGGGGHIATRHGGIVEASGNGHQSWSVDLSPVTLSQIVEAHVCTELSDDRIDFPQVSCESYQLD
jgi:hypothetical protein